MREEFLRLIKEDRYIEAAELFYFLVKNKTSEKFDEHLELIDIFLRKALPFLVNHEPVWLIKNPEFTLKFLNLTADAFERDYYPSDMIYHAMHLRCFLAIADALRKDVQGVHREVLYAADSEIGEPKEIDNWPLSHLEEFLKKNGITAAILNAFFRAYFDYLKEIGRGDIVERIGWIIEKGIFELQNEETRPGVVRGLFIKEKEKTGVIKNILVRIEEGEETIEYSHLEREELGESIRDAADVARKVAHNFLVQRGYPEGLSNRKVIWQIVRTNGKAEDMSIFYDGASICLPLATAILSYYLSQPVASDIAITGAFNIHSIEEGRILGVAGIQAKVEVALESGIKKIFVPMVNKRDLDLAAEKRAEELGAEIVPVQKLYDIYTNLFYKPKPETLGSIIRDVFKGISTFLHIRKLKAEIKPDYMEQEKHIWLVSGIYALLYVLDGLGIYFTYHKTSFLSSAIMILAGAVIIIFGLIICFILPQVILEREKRSSWHISIGITFFSMAIVYSIYLPMIPFTTIDLSKIFDWPPILGVLKDFIILWMFAALFVTNIYNYTVALNFLIKRRQFVTVRNILKGQEESEAMLPTAVIRLGWKEGVLAAAIAAVFLLIFEMIYYTALYEGVKQNAFIVIFGITRDAVFIIAAAEVLIWYKGVLSTIRKKAGKQIY